MNTPHLPVRVWDLPTRLFHWALLACVVALFVTAYAPGNWIEWHARVGYLVMTLLLFRIVWGVIGGHWSRFASFLPGRGYRAGHSVAGALAVVVMLGVLGAQVATGLISDDQIAFTGPLNRFVSNDQGLAASAWHTGPGQWLLVGLIALHVAAIAFYVVVRRQRLVRAMIAGDKELPAGISLEAEGVIVATRDTAASRALALAVFVLCAGLVYVVVTAA